MMSAGFRPSGGTRDAESGQRETPWSGSQRAYQGNETCHGNEASFIDSVRRRSQSLADELRLELNNLKRNLSLLTIPSRSRQENGDTGGTRRFSIDHLLSLSSSSSELITDCESCYEDLESPSSATGREEDAVGTRRKPIQPAGNTTRHGTEAQQWNGSLV
ncbi:hypothetical protein F66182_9500 [Fusarium sp. NRRL 66182]|nr:hypothetical protein F66182_9500 [Fusarium sp. NRRL 66182]